MTPLERADRAQTLLDDLAFKELQAEIRAELIRAIEAVPVTDIERLQEVVLGLQIHNRQKKVLERWIADGKVEQKKLNDMNYRDRIRQVWSKG